MKRLTKIDRYNHYYTNEKIYSRTNEFDCYDGSTVTKLGQLEDIEEELGVGLSILFYAFNNGAWFRAYDLTTNKICFIDKETLLHSIEFSNYRFCIRREKLGCYFYNTGGLVYPFKDYGETWALTREELEKWKK